MSIKSLFEDIADAIREKSGSSDTYTPVEMPSAIRNIPSGSGTASGVSYDNTSSGLTASNVQDAIDELSGNVSTINSDLSELYTVVSGTTYADLKSTIMALSNKEFANSTLRVNGGMTLKPDYNGGGDGIREYSRWAWSSNSTENYIVLFFASSYDSLRSLAKAINGTVTQTAYALTGWELYYIKDI